MLLVGFVSKHGHGGGIGFSIYFSANSALASQSSARHCRSLLRQRLRMPAQMGKSGTRPRSASSMKVSVRLMNRCSCYWESKERRRSAFSVGTVSISAGFQFAGFDKGNARDFRQKQVEYERQGNEVDAVLGMPSHGEVSEPEDPFKSNSDAWVFPRPDSQTSERVRPGDCLKRAS